MKENLILPKLIFDWSILTVRIAKMLAAKGTHQNYLCYLETGSLPFSCDINFIFKRLYTMLYLGMLHPDTILILLRNFMPIRLRLSEVVNTNSLNHTNILSRGRIIPQVVLLL